MIIKREKWVIKTLRGRLSSQIEASYRGFISLIESWSSSNKTETRFLNRLLDEKMKTEKKIKKNIKPKMIRRSKIRNFVLRKETIIFAMSNMWEISQRYWVKYVDNNDFGYEEFEAIHWINHDFLVILNPEAYDIDCQIEDGIVNKRMFDYNSLKNKGVNRSKVSVKQEN